MEKETMGRVGLLVVISVFVPCYLMAGAGRVSLYAQQSLGDCSYYDTSPSTMLVYLIHERNMDGASFVKFRVASGGGFTGVYQGENISASMIVGDTQTGITIYYGYCMNSVVHVIGFIGYTMFGTSPTCSYLDIVTHPEAPTGCVEVYDCSGAVENDDTIRRFRINPSHAQCPVWCDLAKAPEYAEPCTVPVEGATWGRIKAIYDSTSG